MLEWYLNGYHDPQSRFGACYLQGEVGHVWMPRIWPFACRHLIRSPPGQASHPVDMHTKRDTT